MSLYIVNNNNLEGGKVKWEWSIKILVLGYYKTSYKQIKNFFTSKAKT